MVRMKSRSISSRRGCFTLKSLKASDRACNETLSGSIIGTPHTAGSGSDQVRRAGAVPAVSGPGTFWTGGPLVVLALRDRAVAEATAPHRSPVVARIAPTGAR